MYTKLNPVGIFASVALSTVAAMTVVQGAMAVSEAPPLEAGRSETIATPTTVDAIRQKAKASTVLLLSTDTIGSGVLINRTGDQYTVLTAAHVVDQAETYSLITADGKRRAIDRTAIRPLRNLDLAVLTFSDRRSYSTATVGDSTQVALNTPCHIGGFLYFAGKPVLNFSQGQFTANVHQPLTEGFTLACSNNVFPGMSGGPMLNQHGHLIGIVGLADASIKLQSQDLNSKQKVQSGFSAGVPMNTFLRAVSSTLPQQDFPDPVQVSSRRPTTATEFYLQARDREAQKDFKGAIAIYDRAIALNPNYVKAYVKRGFAYAALKEYDRAIASHNQAIALNPNYIGAYLGRGRAHHHRRDHTQAIADYSQAIVLEPQYTYSYVFRGLVYIDAKLYPQAITDLNQAIMLAPKNAWAYLGRGSAFDQMGDYTKAIADYSKAIELQPDYANAYYNRGLAQSKLKDYRQAITDYDQAIALNPEDAEAYYLRGLAYHDIKQYDRAIANYNQAIAHSPKQAQFYLQRGLSYFRLKRDGQAIADFDQAIALKPNFAASYMGRGGAYLFKGDKRRAYRDLQKAIRLYQRQNQPQGVATAQQLLRYLDLQ